MKKTALLFFLFCAANLFAQHDSLAKAFAVCTNDSVFITQHSSKPFRRYTEELKKPNSPKPDESVGLAIYQADQGQMLGPFVGKKMTRYYKILRVDSGTGVSMKHILLDKKLHPQNWIDSVSRMIMAGAKTAADMDQYCWDFSDPGSGSKPGSCDLINEYAEDYVPPVRDACRTAVAGKVFSVNSDFGTHIIMLTAPAKKVRRSVEYVVLDIPAK